MARGQDGGAGGGGLIQDIMGGARPAPTDEHDKNNNSFK